MRYRTGNRNARNIYQVGDDGTEVHVGCMFTEDDGRRVVAALNSSQTVTPAPFRHANGRPCHGCQICLDEP